MIPKYCPKGRRMVIAAAASVAPRSSVLQFPIVHRPTFSACCPDPLVGSGSWVTDCVRCCSTPNSVSSCYSSFSGPSNWALFGSPVPWTLSWSSFSPGVRLEGHQRRRSERSNWCEFEWQVKSDESSRTRWKYETRFVLLLNQLYRPPVPPLLIIHSHLLLMTRQNRVNPMDRLMGKVKFVLTRRSAGNFHLN